jgi:hypothetical protein
LDVQEKQITEDLTAEEIRAEWPGREPADVEIGDVDSLAEKYPDVADDLRAWSR